jgi:hypothetical protein
MRIRGKADRGENKPAQQDGANANVALDHG